MAFFTLYTIGHRPPQWVREGFTDYAKRLPPAWGLELVELKAEPRSSDCAAERERARARECERLRARIPAGSRLVALDERGAAWTTETLAAKLAGWRDAARPVAFVIGGPDGFTDAFRADADELWQLSRLTLPHALVRVIVAEALYRAWSLLAGHPYHRGGATE